MLVVGAQLLRHSIAEHVLVNVAINGTQRQCDCEQLYTEAAGRTLRS